MNVRLAVNSFWGIVKIKYIFLYFIIDKYFIFNKFNEANIVKIYIIGNAKYLMCTSRGMILYIEQIWQRHCITRDLILISI
jgi:uncharacterized protein Smg (DUF494 family)